MVTTRSHSADKQWAQLLIRQTLEDSEIAIGALAPRERRRSCQSVALTAQPPEKASESPADQKVASGVLIKFRAPFFIL